MITRGMKWVILLVLNATLLSVFSPKMALGQEEIAPDPRFGMTEAFWEPDEAAELKVGWDRILFYWRELQPTGPDDWNTLHVREEWLSEAQAQGRTVVGLIKNTAPWASEDGTEAGLPRGLYLPIDDEDNLWAAFVRRVAGYYSDRNVHHWIIWNEPEIKPGVYGFEFAGSTKDYYQLVKVAYQVMKQEDPAAVIHLAGLTWWHDQTYLQRLINVAAADPDAPANRYFFDVISLHVYFRPETIPIILNAVQAIQREHDLDKPIWINETNAPPNQDPAWPISRPDFPIDLDQQAWFLIQSFALGFSEGADVIGVYKLIDVHLPTGAESFGVLRPDFSRRPAFEAFKTITGNLNRFHTTRKQVDPRFYAVTFARSGAITRVLWARTPEPIHLRLPALADSGKLIGPTGAETFVQPANGAHVIRLEGARCLAECLVGGPPVFLVEQAAMPSGGPGPASILGPEVEATPATVSLDTTPTATPTPTETPSPTATATPAPTETPIPTATSTPMDERAQPGLNSIASGPETVETTPKPGTELAQQANGSPVPVTQPAADRAQRELELLSVGGASCLGVAIIALLLVRRLSKGRDD